MMQASAKDWRRQAGPVLVVLLAAGIAGCSGLVPGSHVRAPDADPWFGPPAEAAEPLLPELVRIQRIQPGVGGAAPDAAAPLPADLAQAPERYEYRVGPGDVLTITVWEHPELTIPAGSERMAEEAGNWVHDDGTIYYPYVGTLKVAGLRVTEIRDLILRKLAHYIENPQVDVTVAAFRSQLVYVTGNVNNPGTYPVTNVPMRLVDAIGLAGGLDERADWRNVTLTRDGREYRLSLRAIYERGDPRSNVLLRGGDVVHIGRDDDNKIFVLGEVTEPAAMPMGRNGLTLAEALAQAGGIDELQANASGVFVMRRAVGGKPGQIDLYQLDAKQATALVLADDFELQSRDIVYVTAAPVARWNRVIQQLLPTLQGIYLGAATQEELRDN
ncbi:MAG: polysaccharide export protein [Pseudomonadota bacterium]